MTGITLRKKSAPERRSVRCYSTGGWPVRTAVDLSVPPLLQSLFQSAELLAQGEDLIAEGIAFRGLGPLLRLRLGGRAVQPPRPRGPFAEHAVGLALARHDAVEARLERALDEVLPRLAVLDELVEEGGGQRGAAVPLVLENDLGERDRGQVFPRGHVHDRDLLARADELFELFERDVPALLRIVELAVRVTLDHVRHGERQSNTARHSRQGGQAVYGLRHTSLLGRNLPSCQTESLPPDSRGLLGQVRSTAAAVSTERLMVI